MTEQRAPDRLVLLTSTVLGGLGALFATTGSAVVTLTGAIVVLVVVLTAFLRRGTEDRREGRDVAGPGAEFDDLFRSEYPKLVTYLVLLGFERDTAEDAAAEAMIDYVAVMETVTSPKAWLRVTARRKAAVAAKAVGGRRTQAFDALRLGVAAADGDWVTGTDLKLTLETAMLALPDKQRAVMALHLTGLSHGEIAEALDCTEQQSRANLRHARKALRAIFEEGGKR